MKLLNNRRITDYHSSENYFLNSVHDECIDVKGRQIWIHGVKDTDPLYNEGEEPGVEYQMAARVIKNLNILYTSNKKKPVTIHLQTCGGDVVQGLAIYDMIKAMPFKITIISYTHARSMSSYILQAADERLLMPNSYFMFHDGEMWTGGTMKQAKSYMEFTEILDKQLEMIYVNSLQKKGKYKNEPVSKLKEILRSNMDKKEDVYLTAQEAVEWGFADGIFEGFK